MDSRFVPLWLATTMFEESVVLVDAGGRPEGRVLFEPQSIVTITSAARDQAYTEGRDFVVDRAARTISRLPESRMPAVTRATIEASAGSLTHARTVSVTYTHALPAPQWQPQATGGRLPHVSALLRSEAPISISVTGDSISEGYDASGFHGLAPFNAAYPSLVAGAITRACGAKVNLRNCATAGWTAADALADTSRIAATNPDLVIVAFGMNDASYADADEFTGNIRRLVEHVRTTAHQAEFLLVTPMLPTPECTWVVPDRFEQYRTSLMTLCGDGVQVADVTAVWRALISHKSSHDLSGNGLNHPNDFGHRVYADVICSYLIPPD